MMSYVDCLGRESADLTSRCLNPQSDETIELLPKKFPVFQPKAEGSLRRRLLVARVHHQYNTLRSRDPPPLNQSAAWTEQDNKDESHKLKTNHRTNDWPRIRPATPSLKHQEVDLLQAPPQALPPQFKYKPKKRRRFFKRRKNSSTPLYKDSDHKWSVHYSTHKPLHGLLFLPSSSRGSHEDHDDLWLSRHHEAGPAPFTSRPRISQSEQRRGFEWRQRCRKMKSRIRNCLSESCFWICLKFSVSTRKSSLDSDDDEHLVVGVARPMTPLVLTSCWEGPSSRVEDVTSCVEGGTSCRLPTPEEQTRRRAQTVMADIVAINVTGESFDRQASLSLSHSLSHRSGSNRNRPGTAYSLDLAPAPDLIQSTVRTCRDLPLDQDLPQYMPQDLPLDLDLNQLRPGPELRRIRAPRSDLSSLMETLTSSRRLQDSATYRAIYYTPVEHQDSQENQWDGESLSSAPLEPWCYRALTPSSSHQGEVSGSVCGEGWSCEPLLSCASTSQLSLRSESSSCSHTALYINDDSLQTSDPEITACSMASSSSLNFHQDSSPSYQSLHSETGANLSLNLERAPCSLPEFPLHMSVDPAQVSAPNIDKMAHSSSLDLPQNSSLSCQSFDSDTGSVLSLNLDKSSSFSVSSLASSVSTHSCSSSLSRTFSLRKAKRPPAPPQRNQSLKRPPKPPRLSLEQRARGQPIHGAMDRGIANTTANTASTTPDSPADDPWVKKMSSATSRSEDDCMSSFGSQQYTTTTATAQSLPSPSSGYSSRGNTPLSSPVSPSSPHTDSAPSPDTVLMRPAKSRKTRSRPVSGIKPRPPERTTSLLSSPFSSSSSLSSLDMPPTQAPPPAPPLPVSRLHVSDYAPPPDAAILSQMPDQPLPPPPPPLPPLNSLPLPPPLPVSYHKPLDCSFAPENTPLLSSVPHAILPPPPPPLPSRSALPPPPPPPLPPPLPLAVTHKLPPNFFETKISTSHSTSSPAFEVTPLPPSPQPTAHPPTPSAPGSPHFPCRPLVTAQALRNVRLRSVKSHEFMRANSLPTMEAQSDGSNDLLQRKHSSTHSVHEGGGAQEERHLDSSSKTVGRDQKLPEKDRSRGFSPVKPETDVSASEPHHSEKNKDLSLSHGFPAAHMSLQENVGQKSAESPVSGLNITETKTNQEVSAFVASPTETSGVFDSTMSNVTQTESVCSVDEAQNCICANTDEPEQTLYNQLSRRQNSAAAQMMDQGSPGWNLNIVETKARPEPPEEDSHFSAHQDQCEEELFLNVQSESSVKALSDTQSLNAETESEVLKLNQSLDKVLMSRDVSFTEFKKVLEELDAYVEASDKETFYKPGTLSPDQSKAGSYSTESFSGEGVNITNISNTNQLQENTPNLCREQVTTEILSHGVQIQRAEVSHVKQYRLSESSLRAGHSVAFTERHQAYLDMYTMLAQSSLSTEPYEDGLNHRPPKTSVQKPIRKSKTRTRDYYHVAQSNDKDQTEGLVTDGPWVKVQQNAAITEEDKQEERQEERQEESPYWSLCGGNPKDKADISFSGKESRASGAKVKPTLPKKPDLKILTLLNKTGQDMDPNDKKSSTDRNVALLRREKPPIPSKKPDLRRLPSNRQEELSPACPEVWTTRTNGEHTAPSGPSQKCGPKMEQCEAASEAEAGGSKERHLQRLPSSLETGLRTYGTGSGLKSEAVVLHNQNSWMESLENLGSYRQRMANVDHFSIWRQRNMFSPGISDQRFTHMELYEAQSETQEFNWTNGAENVQSPNVQSEREFEENVRSYYDDSFKHDSKCFFSENQSEEQVWRRQETALSNEEQGLQPEPGQSHIHHDCGPVRLGSGPGLQEAQWSGSQGLNRSTRLRPRDDRAESGLRAEVWQRNRGHTGDTEGSLGAEHLAKVGVSRLKQTPKRQRKRHVQVSTRLSCSSSSSSEDESPVMSHRANRLIGQSSLSLSSALSSDSLKEAPSLTDLFIQEPGEQPTGVLSEAEAGHVTMAQTRSTDDLFALIHSAVQEGAI